MLFSQRLRLIKNYQAWIAEINKNDDYVLQDTSLTFLAYLDSHGLLNEEKVSKENGGRDDGVLCKCEDCKYYNNNDALFPCGGCENHSEFEHK